MFTSKFGVARLTIFSTEEALHEALDCESKAHTLPCGQATSEAIGPRRSHHATY